MPSGYADMSFYAAAFGEAPARALVPRLRTLFFPRFAAGLSSAWFRG